MYNLQRKYEFEVYQADNTFKAVAEKLGYTTGTTKSKASQKEPAVMCETGLYLDKFLRDKKAILTYSDNVKRQYDSSFYFQQALEYFGFTRNQLKYKIQRKDLSVYAFIGEYLHNYLVKNKLIYYKKNYDSK